MEIVGKNSFIQISKESMQKGVTRVTIKDTTDGGLRYTMWFPHHIKEDLIKALQEVPDEHTKLL